MKVLMIERAAQVVHLFLNPERNFLRAEENLRMIHLSPEEKVFLQGHRVNHLVSQEKKDHSVSLRQVNEASVHQDLLREVSIKKIQLNRFAPEETMILQREEVHQASRHSVSHVEKDPSASLHLHHQVNAVSVHPDLQEVSIKKIQVSLSAGKEMMIHLKEEDHSANQEKRDHSVNLQANAESVHPDLQEEDLIKKIQANLSVQEEKTILRKVQAILHAGPNHLRNRKKKNHLERATLVNLRQRDLSRNLVFVN